jgi:hypothetical protein
MNFRYLLWQLGRELRQPAVLFLTGIYIAILCCMSFFVSFEMSGSIIHVVHIGSIHINEPRLLTMEILPAYSGALTTICLLLFLLAASSSCAESLYHPLNAVLLITPLTKKQIYCTSWISISFLFALTFGAFSLLLSLIIGIKTGLYAFAPYGFSIMWTTLLYASCSAVAWSLIPIFKKPTSVLILMIAILVLANKLDGLREWYFRTLSVLIPPLDNYRQAALNALVPSHEPDKLVLPAVMSFLYFSVALFFYTKQDVQ